MTDHEIISEVLGGNHDAFRVLANRYMPLVAGFIHGKARHKADAEDLIQEVFLTAFQHLGSLRNHDRLGPWLLRIARAKAADYHRALKRRPISSHEDPSKTNEEPLEAPDQRPGPLEITQSAMYADAIEQALARLNDKYRVVLYLKLYEDLTSQQIAEQLGTRESAVRMRIMRGLELLRKELRRKGFEP